MPTSAWYVTFAYTPRQPDARDLGLGQRDRVYAELL